MAVPSWMLNPAQTSPQKVTDCEAVSILRTDQFHLRFQVREGMSGAQGVTPVGLRPWGARRGDPSSGDAEMEEACAVMDFLEEAAPAGLWSGGSGGKGAPGRGLQSRCRDGTDLAGRKHESKHSKAEGSGLRSLLTSLSFLICYWATIYLRFQVPHVPGTVPSALPRLLHFILRANPRRQFVYPHLLDKETEGAQEVKRLVQSHIAYYRWTGRGLTSILPA